MHRGYIKFAMACHLFQLVQVRQWSVDLLSFPTHDLSQCGFCAEPATVGLQSAQCGQ